MPESLELKQNDIGIQFVATITSDGSTPIDISSCSGFNMIFTRPDGTKYVVVASLLNTGTDGKIQYTSTNTDLTVVGRWKIQASYLKSGNIRYTSIDFYCYA